VFVPAATWFRRGQSSPYDAATPPARSVRYRTDPAADWRSFTAPVYDRYGNCLATDVKGANMNASKIAAIVLIVAGVLGLAYGSFSYTKKTHDINVGPIEMSVKEKQTINVPVWAGVGAIAIGAALLLLGGRKL
jgi:hypothetical protein